MNATNLDHLMRAVRETYVATVNSSCTFYYGITLQWDYRERHVGISMPGYVNRTLLTYATSLSPIVPNIRPTPGLSPTMAPNNNSPKNPIIIRH